MSNPGVIALLGPTASGKSDLAARLARWLGRRGLPAEIVNADSMLVYRGMDIGTAKPSPQVRAEIPHHVIDVADISQKASVAWFQRLARGAIADCRARGVQPIVVGGSALYLRAILDRFDFPGGDPALRSRLEAELAEVGPAVLHERLGSLDPAAAAAIEPGNGRRIVRALEVVTTTGSFRARLPAPEYALDHVVQLGLELPRDRLDERVAARAEAMWRAGLAEEVRGLLDRGLRQAPTASRAIGYRQAVDWLDGRLSRVEAQGLTTLKTRQFARKQLAWWRRDGRITWLPAEPAPEPEAVIRQVPWLAGLSPSG